MKLTFSPLVNTDWPEFKNVTIIRGDLIHPVVSGNKLYKLQPILQQAHAAHTQTIISVGGRYSNHLHALAWAARESGLHSVGLVRGYPEQPLTPTLSDCQSWGMTFHFVSHSEYLNRYSDDFWNPWLRSYPSSMRVDEGGWGEMAIMGSSLWWDSIPDDVDLVVTAVGSGSTYAGLLLSKPSNVVVVGVPVFNDSDKYQDLMLKLRNVGIASDDIHLWTGYAGRGFGKLDLPQLTFKTVFERASAIQLDPVYTSKAFHALACQLQKHPLKNQKIAILHTGGLQGNRT